MTHAGDRPGDTGTHAAPGTTAERSLGALAEASRRPRIGLVGGSGSMKCTAAIGLWKVLQREGIPVDVAIGCSGGAIYTAALALGMNVDDIERQSLVMWRDLFNRLSVRSVARALLPGLFGFSDRVGLLDDRRICDVIWNTFGQYTFADTRIPLHIAATDFATGEKVVLNSGSLADAVRASIALPLLLRAWDVDGRRLIDGGASNPLPLDVAILEGCDVILAMGFENQYGGTISSFVGAVGRTTTIVTNHLLRATYAFYSVAHHAEIIPMLPEFDRPINPLNADEIPYIIAQGEKVAEAQLPYLQRFLSAARG